MAARKPPLAGHLAMEPTPVHEGLTEFIAKQTGHTVPVGDVALVQRLYPLYLKSPAVAKAREAEKAAREAEREKKRQAKAARLQARLDAIEAERQRLLRELGIEAEQESKEGSVLPFPKPKAVAPEVEEDEEDEGPVEIVLEDGFEDGDDDEEWDEDDDEEEDF